MGYLKDTAIAITSDHGNYRAQRYGKITNFFKSNLLTHYHPRRNHKGNMNISKYDGVGFFNFKSNMNLNKRNSKNQLRNIAEINIRNIFEKNCI